MSEITTRDHLSLFVDYASIRELLVLEEGEDTTSAAYPVLYISVEGIIIPCLIDTGCQVSVMSESIFRRCSNKREWPVLPLVKTNLSGAIPGKSVPIKIQTEVEFLCQGHYMRANFLVTPVLAIEAILGLDFISRHKGILDIGRNCMTLLVNDCKVEFDFDECLIEERLPSNNVGMYIHTDVTTEGSSDVCCPFDPLSEFEGETMQVIDEDVLCENNEWINLSNDILDDQPEMWMYCHYVDRKEVAKVEHMSDVEIQNLIVEKTRQIADPRDRDDLQHILRSFADVFRCKTGTIKDFLYRFKVKEHKPFFVKPFGIPWALRGKVHDEIKDMLEQGVIEPAVSTYNSPLLCIIKKDGSIRLVLDSRQINTIIEPETDRPETLDCLLQKFHGVKVLSSVDLKSSFWQIELHPECRKFTAFICFGRCYQFKKLPFGLNVSSSAFIRGFDSIIPAELKARITMYVDDILVAEPTWDDHNSVLAELLCVFREKGISVNLSKSEFGKRELKFLGHLVSAEGIKPDPEKLTAISEFPTPLNKRQLRQYLGLINFYKKFVQLPSIAATRLCTLTGKNARWDWDEDAEREFSELKEALLAAPLLVHPDLSKEFCMSTDSSRVGLGVTLFQEYEEDGKVVPKPIAFASRVLNKAERNYTVTELEALAVVYGFTKYRYFLYGRETKVYTDHRALQFLMTAQLTHGRLARWSLLLQEYKFRIVYIPGHLNVVADALSRSPVGLTHSGNTPQDDNVFTAMYLRQVPFENFISTAFLNIAREQIKDDVWRSIKERWRDPQETNIRRFYLVKDDVLFFRRNPTSDAWVVCVPNELVNKLIWYTHFSYGHYGASKCVKQLRRDVYFNNMERRVRRVLAMCKVCQKTKPATVSRRAPLYPILPEKLKDLAAVDLYGPAPRTRQGFQYILVCIELTSKYVTLTPLRNATGRSVARAFRKGFLREVGRVRKVLSDNGPQFRSRQWKDMLAQQKIKPIYISRFHPSSNPAERVMKEMGKLCRVYCSKEHREWDNHLKDFQDIMNELPHGTTGLAPVQVLKNLVVPSKIREVVKFPSCRRERRQELVKEALEKIKSAGEKRKKMFEKYTVRRFEVGQRILVKAHRLSNKGRFISRKFYPVYRGPYRVKRICHPNAVEIETLRSRRSKGVHHVSNLKHFVC